MNNSPQPPPNIPHLMLWFNLVWIIMVILLIWGIRAQKVEFNKADLSSKDYYLEYQFQHYKSGDENELQITKGAYLPAQAPPYIIKGEVYGDLIDKIIWCESKNDCTAQNPDSTAYGLCQFIDGTWKYVQDKWDMELDRYSIYDQRYACERLLREHRLIVIIVMNKLRDKNGKYIEGHLKTNGVFKAGHKPFTTLSSIQKAKATWKKKRIKVLCDFCGREIEITSSRLIYKKHYCNIDCQRNDMKGKTNSPNTQFEKAHLPTFQKFGEDNPNWKGGREHQLKTIRIWKRKREKECPSFKINRRFSKAIWASLRGAKQFRKWENLVGYTIINLMKRLEDLFNDKMNWDNYGSYWEIDHIKPKSLFQYTCAKDNEFKECWALKNLQPLEVIKNRKKADHWVSTEWCWSK